MAREDATMNLADRCIVVSSERKVRAVVASRDTSDAPAIAVTLQMMRLSREFSGKDEGR